jgi:hypothetical protein
LMASDIEPSVQFLSTSLRTVSAASLALSDEYTNYWIEA